MAEHNRETMATSISQYREPSKGPSPLRIYEPPPRIDAVFNAQDANSSKGDRQARIVDHRPYVHHDEVPFPQPRSNFRTLQAWEGVVTAVDGESFSVKLVDLSGDGPDEEAEIDFEEVSADERVLISVGAIFLLHVGYATSEGGQRSRTSILRFRRLPVWTETELASARKTAQEQADTIRWTT